MNEKTIIDMKLKQLIMVCKKTQNYRKLAVVGFTLLSNKVNEIGILLGFQSRNHRAGESLSSYIKKIESFTLENLNLSLIPKNLQDKLKIIELLFLKVKGDIPKEQVKEIFEIYYSLRKIEVPNVHENLTSRDFSEMDKMNSLSFSGRGREKRIDPVKTMMYQILNDKERDIDILLQKGYTKNILEKALRVKALRKSIERGTSKKIKISGSLANCLEYRHSFSRFKAYCILGIGTVFGLLGITVLIEIILYPQLTNVFSIIILIFFICSIISLLIYNNVLKKRDLT